MSYYERMFGGVSMTPICKMDGAEMLLGHHIVRRASDGSVTEEYAYNVRVFGAEPKTLIDLARRSGLTVGDQHGS